MTRQRLLLKDEPFAALADITRQKLNANLLRWWAEQKLAALFVYKAGEVDLAKVATLQCVNKKVGQDVKARVGTK